MRRRATACPTAPACWSRPQGRVEKGQRLVEWDPHTLPIVTEATGRAVFMDMVEGVTFREVVDEATGRASKELTDWRQQTRGTSLRPSVLIQDDEAQPVKLPSGAEARYYLPVGAILNVEAGVEVHAGDVIARLPKEASKTRDITGGLPRVAELFEARRPKDPAIIAEAAGRVEYGKDYKTKRRLRIVPPEEDREAIEYLIPKGRHVVVQEGDVVREGDLLVEGNPVPHDILRVKGVEALAAFLVNEIQEVYRLQGVKINDKHVEVIVRQMLQKVEITDPGETTFLTGEQVDKLEFDAVNERVVADNRAPAIGDPGAAGDHQGVAADPVVHLGGLLPGDHPGADRRRLRRQDRRARRAQGERHRRPPDPGRQRRRDEPPEAARGEQRAVRSARRSCRPRRP